MIILASWRGPGGLARHLSKVGPDSNEKVVVRTDLCVNAFGDIDEDIRNFSAMSRMAGKKRELIHIIISPTEQLTHHQERSMLQQLLSAYNIPADHPMLVVMHLKFSEGRLCPHYHIVMSAVRSNGRVIRDSHSKIKNECVARTLEIEFGHERVVGAHNKAVHAYLDCERPDIALLVDPHARPRRSAARTLNEKQQAERYRVDAKKVDAQVLHIYMQSNGSMKTFAVLLNKAGFTVGRGKSAVLVIHEDSGFYGSMARVINRAAKSAKVDLKVSAESFEAAFGRAEPSEIARADGFSRARRRAEAGLGREFAKAVFEAGADGDMNGADAEKARLKTHLDASKDRFARAASIRAIQDAIFILYRQRDAARKRRVDRAFRTAGMVRTRGYVRRAFQLAAGATLLTGAGLTFALGVGAIAAGAAIYHRTQAYPKAQKIAAEATRDRHADLALARRAAAKMMDDSKSASHSQHAGSGPSKSLSTPTPVGKPRDRTSDSGKQFSFNQVDKADRALVGLYAQLVLSRRRPDIVTSIGAALGEPLARDIKTFLANASQQQINVMSGWFKETKSLLHAAAAALHKRGHGDVATVVKAYVTASINAGQGMA